MFSVVILTLNEERNLPRCLASLDGACDVVVLDSGSMDRTREMAINGGARFVSHLFEDFATQRNYAQEAITWRYPWLFHLDADEQLTPALNAECREIAAANPADIDGYWVAPRMFFHGRWIPRCTDFPAFQARFVHSKRFRFVQTGHGQRESGQMRMACLRANYLHNLSSRSDEELEQKHRRYAHQEAVTYLAQRNVQSTQGARFLARDPLIRRRALKEFSYRLPARGSLRFVYQYVLRLGFLDGREGYRYCRLLARYEGWTANEIRLLRKKQT